MRDPNGYTSGDHAERFASEQLEVWQRRNDDNVSGAAANVLLDQVQAALDEERFADAMTLLGLLSAAHLYGEPLMRYYYLYGWEMLILKQWDKAWVALTTALAWADRLQATVTAVWSRYRLGVIHYRNGELAAAEYQFIACWNITYDCGSEFDDPKLKLFIDLSLGNATLRQGRVNNAIGHYQDALRDAAKFDSKKWRGSIYWGLGLAHFYQGDLGVAKVEIGEALHLQQAPVNASLAKITGMYGMILIEVNQPHAAERELNHTIFLARQAGDNTSLVVANSNLAEAHLAQGCLSSALTYAEHALAQAQALGLTPLNIAQTRLTLAKVCVEQGEYEKAAMLFAEAETTMCKSGDQMKYMQLLYEYSRLLKKVGDYSGAVQKLTLACYLRNPAWR